MTLVRKSGRDFIVAATSDGLGVLLAEQMRMRLNQNPSPGEVRSWERSLPVLAEDLQAAGLDQAEVLLEHRLPYTSKRVDVILAGVHPTTRRPSYVVIELKQWGSFAAVRDGEDLVTVDGTGSQLRLHPQRQVSDYCQYLQDFAGALTANEAHLSGVAYLHNAPALDALALHAPTDFAHIYSLAEREAFRGFLRSQIAPDTSGGPAADLLLRGALTPTPQLLEVAAQQLQERDQFVLLDSQRVAYELVMRAVRQAREGDHKQVVIVTGGPGSGKSVIALTLVGELAAMGHSVMHATGSRSFTTTLRRVAGKGSRRTANLFNYFNSYMDSARNAIDVLILDEAHRLRQTSANRFTRAALRTGRSQLDELVSAARVPVFLLDEHQIVRPGEMGTVAEIRNHAEAHGIAVVEVSLDDQFRCGGSASYIEWVLRLLDLNPGGPVVWDGDDTFDLLVADSPSELEDQLRAEMDAGANARMAAGYCWPWSDPTPQQTLIPDVSIDGWSRPWNVKADRAVGDAPPSSLWATATGGFGQVGCVYTAQGFEYDWNGVILGPDMVRRGDAWVFDRTANKDPDFRNRTKVSDEQFAAAVRNVYKVLLTRGMQGTVLYSTDPETQQFLRSLVPSGR